MCPYLQVGWLPPPTDSLLAMLICTVITINLIARMASTDNAAFGALLPELVAGWKPLRDKPEESPEGTLRALWFLAANERRPVERCRVGPLPALNDAAYARLNELVRQRVDGVPLAHLTGRQCFMGLEMLAGPEALIPRKETEILGYASLDMLRAAVAESGGAAVIDLCTGSGNLALALAHHEPAGRVYAADLSPSAVELARRNAVHLGLQYRVAFHIGDLFTPFDQELFVGKVDLVICNPPYISSQRVVAMPLEVGSHEPHLAFNGGPFGVSLLNRLIAEAPRYLRQGGWLCFEVGLGQGAHIARRLESNTAYCEIRSCSDADGNPRALLARRS